MRRLPGGRGAAAGRRAAERAAHRHRLRGAPSPAGRPGAPEPRAAAARAQAGFRRRGRAERSGHRAGRPASGRHVGARSTSTSPCRTDPRPPRGARRRAPAVHPSPNLTSHDLPNPAVAARRRRRVVRLLHRRPGPRARPLLLRSRGHPPGAGVQRRVLAHALELVHHLRPALGLALREHPHPLPRRAAHGHRRGRRGAPEGRRAVQAAHRRGPRVVRAGGEARAVRGHPRRHRPLQPPGHRHPDPRGGVGDQARCRSTSRASTSRSRRSRSSTSTCPRRSRRRRTRRRPRTNCSRPRRWT